MLGVFGGVEVNVTVGAHLGWVPRIPLAGLSVMVGPYSSAQEHERHVLDTTGSGNWYQSEYDELRFDRTSGELVSLWLHIPERNADLGPVLPGWLAMPPTTGRLRGGDIAGFDLEPTTERWCSSDGRHLACSYGRLPNAPDDATRLRVAPAFDLLFAAGRLAGWLIENPERHLVAAWETPHTDTADDELGRYLHDYLDIVTPPNIEAMEDQDPTVRQLLEGLDAHIDENHGSTTRRIILKRQITNLIDFFYG